MAVLFSIYAFFAICVGLFYAFAVVWTLITKPATAIFTPIQQRIAFMLISTVILCYLLILFAKNC
jgi:hypothetical protein